MEFFHGKSKEKRKVVKQENGAKWGSEGQFSN